MLALRRACRPAGPPGSVVPLLAATAGAPAPRSRPAVNLAAVAAAADDHLAAAAAAQEQARQSHLAAPHRRRGVDKRRHRQDSRPAFVPSTVWGTASMQNCQVEFGAVLALKSGRPPPRRPLRSSTPTATAQARAPHRQAVRPVQPMKSLSVSARPAPSMRGFSPPLTGGRDAAPADRQGGADARYGCAGWLGGRAARRPGDDFQLGRCGVGGRHAEAPASARGGNRCRWHAGNECSWKSTVGGCGERI